MGPFWCPSQKVWVYVDQMQQVHLHPDNEPNQPNQWQINTQNNYWLVKDIEHNTNQLIYLNQGKCYGISLNKRFKDELLIREYDANEQIYATKATPLLKTFNQAELDFQWDGKRVSLNDLNQSILTLFSSMCESIPDNNPPDTPEQQQATWNDWKSLLVRDNLANSPGLSSTFGEDTARVYEELQVTLDSLLVINDYPNMDSYRKVLEAVLTDCQNEKYRELYATCYKTGWNTDLRLNRDLEMKELGDLKRHYIFSLLIEERKNLLEHYDLFTPLDKTVLDQPDLTMTRTPSDVARHEEKQATDDSAENFDLALAIQNSLDAQHSPNSNSEPIQTPSNQISSSFQFQCGVALAAASILGSAIGLALFFATTAPVLAVLVPVGVLLAGSAALYGIFKCKSTAASNPRFPSGDREYADLNQP